MMSRTIILLLRPFKIIAIIMLSSCYSYFAFANTENKVVVYMPSPAGLANQLAADFKQKTGIEVEQFQGTTGEILARLETEKSTPFADVVILASWSDGLQLKASNSLISYQAKNSAKMKADWVDNEHMLYGTSASALGVIYNTLIYPSLNADWAELTKPPYQNQIVIPDPEKSGATKDFLAGYLYANQTKNGWAVWQALAENKMTIPGANKAALDAVLTGAKGILVAGVDYNAYVEMQKGEPIKIYYPASGTVINPRPAMIMKSSPHLANAQQFMDYLLSDDAQMLVAKAYLLPGRTDISAIKREGIEQIPTLKTDWQWMTENSTDIAKKFKQLFK